MDRCLELENVSASIAGSGSRGSSMMVLKAFATRTSPPVDMFGLDHVHTGPTGLHPTEHTAIDHRASRIRLEINGDSEGIVHVGLGPAQPADIQSCLLGVEVTPVVIAAQHPAFSAHLRRFPLSIDVDHGLALKKGGEKDHFVHIVTIIGAGVLVRCDGDVLAPSEYERGIQICGSRFKPVKLNISPSHLGPAGQPQGRGPEKNRRGYRCP